MSENAGITGGHRVSPELAEAALGRLLASPYFSNSRRLSEFLRLVVRKTLAGETVQITERLIAVEIYNRHPDYDSQLDPIVRVESDRLRARLRDYYHADGHADLVRIEIPPGSLAPSIKFQSIPSPGSAPRRTPIWLGVAASLIAVATTAALVPFSRRAPDPRNSIAVLPFTNQGGVPDKDYFTAGLTEQISNRLGRFEKLKVAAGRSAQQFSEKTDVREIGRRLSVDLVLAGGVTFLGDSISVSTRLYNTRDGRPVWSRDFISPVADTPALEEQITSALDAVLQLRQDRAQVTSGWTANPAALDLYLQARYLFHSRKRENIWKSVALYNAALKRDSKFAQAYAGLAEDYVILASNEDQDMSQMMSLARDSVAHALSIDPNLPEALLTRAATEENRDFAKLESLWHAALAANPNSAHGHLWWGLNLLAKGRFAESESEIRQAQVLDPLSLHIGANIGAVYYCNRRYQDAIDQERRILDLDPHVWMARVVLARSYGAVGRFAEGQSILESILRADPSAGVMAELGHLYAISGQRGRAHEIMDQMAALAKTRRVAPFHLAFIQTGLGNFNEALALLEMSYEQKDAPLAFLGVDPRWDPLRPDPRFQKLIHELCLD